VYNNSTNYQVECPACETAGPAGAPRELIVKMWNALPRTPQPTDRDAEIESLARELFGRNLAGTDVYMTSRFVSDCFEGAEAFVQCRDDWRAKRAAG
tara:strand:- start:8962 stop:9252 length:291 start_codon:yes stop_codon:yes gene_type:complete